MCSRALGFRVVNIARDRHAKAGSPGAEPNLSYKFLLLAEPNRLPRVFSIFPATPSLSTHKNRLPVSRPPFLNGLGVHGCLILFWERSVVISQLRGMAYKKAGRCNILVGDYERTRL